MSIKRDLHSEQKLGLTWEDLGAGAPTIIALARLASQAIATESGVSDLSGEARALLFAARDRGVIAIKGANDAFDSVDRFLSVHVELDADSVLAFKSKSEPEVTIRFLDGLRELCASGLVIHHLYREFSLSRVGFETARTLSRDEVAEQLEMGVELGRHEW